MADRQRVVAELGRPETPEETAARKAESSRIYRSSQSFRNLIAALLVTVAVVIVIVLAVPRGEFPDPDPIDTDRIAADVASSFDRTVLVPAVPENWRVNGAAIEGASGGAPAWTIIYVPDDAETTGFVRFAQAFDADEGWARSTLSGASPDGTITAGGIEWDVFEPGDPEAAGNISYALGAQAGPDYVLIYGSVLPATAALVAEAAAPAVQELRNETP